MNPIYETGKGHGIGHSLDSFKSRFVDICEEHLKDRKAKSFAFIFYKPENQEIIEILHNPGALMQLDRISGKTLSVFYFQGFNQALQESFNDVFLKAFKINNCHNLPFILFFNVVDSEVTNIEVIELQQQDRMFAFDELRREIEKYSNGLNQLPGQYEKPEVSKMGKITGTVSNIALDKFIEWLMTKGIEKLSQYM